MYSSAVSRALIASWSFWTISARAAICPSLSLVSTRAVKVARAAWRSSFTLGSASRAAWALSIASWKPPSVAGFRGIIWAVGKRPVTENWMTQTMLPLSQAEAGILSLLLPCTSSALAYTTMRLSTNSRAVEAFLGFTVNSAPTEK